jgi:hypothetical protein
MPAVVEGGGGGRANALLLLLLLLRLLRSILIMVASWRSRHRSTTVGVVGCTWDYWHGAGGPALRVLTIEQYSYSCCCCCFEEASSMSYFASDYSVVAETSLQHSASLSTASEDTLVTAGADAAVHKEMKMVAADFQTHTETPDKESCWCCCCCWQTVADTVADAVALLEDV